jgi:acyl carrier protein
MTEADIRKLACDLLSDLAPDTDPAALPGDKDIREGLDIDSMDFLNFVIALTKRMGIAVPEKDYSKLVTVDGIVAYVARMAQPSA